MMDDRQQTDRQQTEIEAAAFRRRQERFQSAVAIFGEYPDPRVTHELRRQRTGIARVGFAHHQAPGFALVHQVAHGLLAHAGLCR